jgi:5-methylcytosine-specific restriction endonuclease McrA
MSFDPAVIRQQLRLRDGDDCSLCGEVIDFALEPNTTWGPSIEHMKPKAAGGSDDMANLRLAHAMPCNKAKGAIWNGVDYSAHPPRRAAERSRRQERRKAWRRAAERQRRGPWGGVIVVQERGPWGGLLAPARRGIDA